MMRLRAKKSFLLGLGFLLVVVILLEVLVLLGKGPGGRIGTQISDQKVAQLADKVSATCKDVQYRPACYDKAIPQLMDTISMEDAFRVSKVIQQKDDTYWYCHVLGHNLAAREVKKDPSKWKEVIARVPAGMCSNGGIHGAFQERFRTTVMSLDEVNNMKGELKGICEAGPAWNPSGIQQGSCYHAMGHLLMYITGAKTAESAKLCDEIAPNKYVQLCYDGVFMQIFQPLEPEDFGLVKGITPTRETLVSFCSQFEVAKKNSCRSESWPLFREEVKTPAGLIQFCSYAPDAKELERCYRGTFYVLAAVAFHLDPVQIGNFCASLAAAVRSQCYANSASRMIETDSNLISRGVNLCSRADQFRAGAQCWTELIQYSTYNFIAGSADAIRLCDSLPPAWKGMCLEKNNI